MALNAASLAMMRNLMNGGMGGGLSPAAIKLGAITQAPAMGGMSGGGHTPSLGSIPSPQMINPAGDPLLSKNTANSLFNRAEKDVANRLDDYMNNQWLPQGPTQEAQRQMYQQGYGTQENPGPLMGAFPQGMGTIGAGLTNAPISVQDQWANLATGIKGQNIEEQKANADEAYKKTMGEYYTNKQKTDEMSAKAHLISANASMMNAQKKGTGGGKSSGGGKKGVQPDLANFGGGLKTRWGGIY